MALRGVSHLAVRATRASRTLRETRLFHTTSPLNLSKTFRLALNFWQSERYHSLRLTRSFTGSCARYGTDTIVRVPPMAESITEGTLTQLSKQVGDFIEEDEEIAAIETDKIDVSVNAPHSGIIQRLFVAEGDTVNVDQAIAELRPKEKESVNGEENAAQDSLTSASHYPQPQIQGNPQHTESSATPERPATVATVATESNRKEAKNTSTQLSSATDNGSLRKNQSPKHGRGENRVKMTRIRQKTAQHLKESQNNAAFLTTFNEVDMLKIIEFRKQNKETVLEKYGVKLGFMGALAKASVLALKDIPAVNASIENGDTIVYRDYVDLSVAASIPKGLVTPVLRNVESMNIVEIEKGISELVAKARDGKLTMNDLIGGSFTISNSGIWGSLFGTPIINMPQTAVLGAYGILDRPVAVHGQVEIRPMMYIALTYDHRIIDVREAVKFLNIVKDHLEQPESMLLE